MTKKKILHVLNSSAYSGAENVVITIMKHTSHEADLVYVSPDGPIRNFVEENGLKFYAIKKLCRSELRRAIRELTPDIIHAHDFTAGIIAAISTFSIPIINHLHNNSPWLKRYGLYSFVYAICSLKFKKILTVSESVMKEYVFGNLLKNKSDVIGNPIDIEAIKKLANAATNKEKSDIVFIGRLCEQKNPLLFIEIIDKLSNQLPDLKVAIVGDGDLRDVVAKEISDRNLTEIISLYGFLKNPYGLLTNSKVLCMTSTWEGYGLVAAEALSLGKPVVATPVGGIPSIVTEDCGKLCSSVSDFISYLNKYLNDDIFYKNASINAYERANNIMSLPCYFNNIKKSYY